jgi:enoyl-CoA hydratase/carnithine racemase
MSEPSAENPVVIEDRGPIRIVRVHRPDKCNALNLATKRRLVEAFRAADDDPAVRVTVLTGGEAVLVAGTDVAEMARLRPTDLIVERAGEVFEVLDHLSKPTVAAVEGYALGGGCELALATDIVVAGRGARFGQPEIRVGLIPGAGGIHRLVKMAGRQRALRLLLTGDQVGADDARDLGIVSEVVPDGKALDRALAIAQQLLEMPPLSLHLIKELSRNAEDASLGSGLLLERRAFQLVFDTEDHTEGLHAFLEHRKPVYTGK